MSEESEHDNHDNLDLDQALHDAFGDEVADLEIGAIPAGAVMRAGGALRTRRRLAAVSGVAALTVLPVAAVAVFAGGNGSRTVVAGGGTRGAVTTDGNAAGILPTGTPTPTVATTLPAAGPGASPGASSDSSSAVALPRYTPGDNTVAPNPADVYMVVSSGTIYGQSWRLVRDQFVAAADNGGSASLSSIHGTHLPMALKGSPGTVTCEFLGLQWGELPPGTKPDFNGAGQCGSSLPSANGLVTLDPTAVPTGPGVALSAFIGRIADMSRVASVAVTIPGRTTPLQPVVPVAGEHDGYYVVFLPPLSKEDVQNLSETTYDSAGHLVDHVTE